MLILIILPQGNVRRQFINRNNIPNVSGCESDLLECHPDCDECVS